MKCEYCEAVDHLQTVCPARAGDRRKVVSVATLVFLFSFPFYILGFVGGMWWSALRTGFSFTQDFWPDAWTAIRGKSKEEDGESRSV